MYKNYDKYQPNEIYIDPKPLPLPPLRTPPLLERMEAMRPENRQAPFREFMNTVMNYKTGGV